MTSLITDYCSLADLKAHLRIPTANTDDDAQLAFTITAASRAIDAMAFRRFGLAPSPTVRLFSANGEVIDGCVAVPIDDLMSTTGFAVTVDYDGDYTYDTTLTLNTDFDLYPWNAAGDLEPWTHIVFRPNTSTRWVRNERAFSITGQWGWATIPSLVEIACLMQAARWFMRRDSWAGVAGSPDLGNELRLLAALDPDVQAALRPVIRWWGAA